VRQTREDICPEGSFIGSLNAPRGDDWRGNLSEATPVKAQSRKPVNTSWDEIVHVDLPLVRAEPSHVLMAKEGQLVGNTSSMSLH